MAKLIDQLLQDRALRRWRRAATQAPDVDLETLRAFRNRARQLNRQLRRVMHVADSRLMLPLIGTNAIRRPLGTDWVWRPEIWRGPISPPGRAAVTSRTMFGSEATIFHDCSVSELTLRQIRNQREDILSPFGLRMDVFQFDGSFLSLVIDLPADSVEGLRKKHLIRMDVAVELEKPLEIFARLNIKHGPNTDQLVRELPLHEEEVMVEFDLAYSKMNEKRVERMWVDLIFEGPEMNQIMLRDVTFGRRPRAEL